ncbi:Predicted alpha/beta hydrolase [Phaffia rhodozyma]|uniref:Predicted alpha/beta hydrolase n=1 Tax=Phaffia rhodozyma TaxID=264483 RepID=A0A0F7SPM5_PHARH|nr:Predicted alpha/beta hydrolase [Phaffia rhodozyma]
MADDQPVEGNLANPELAITHAQTDNADLLIASTASAGSSTNDKLKENTKEKDDAKDGASKPGFFARAHRLLTIGGAAYVCFLLALLIPVLQRNVIFMNNVPYPFFARYDSPERYGLAPFKARNIQVETSDGESIGAWHLLPRTFYIENVEQYPPSKAFDEDTYDHALQTRPTLIFLHGNAGNRAAPFRVNLISSLSNTLDMNVLAIDYRGFANSTGVPSERGLVLDARAAFEWVINRNGGRPDQVGIVGQSLGTGVGALLVAQLAEEGIHPRMLTMLSPYSSIPSLLKTYTLFRFLPLLSPLRALPLVQDTLTSPRFLQTQFPTLSALASLPRSNPTKILIVHAQDDTEIPSIHSSDIFHAVLHADLGMELLNVIPSGLGVAQMEVHTEKFKERGRIIKDRVEERVVEGWGVVKWFYRSHSDGVAVTWVETLKGGHDSVGGAEGTISLMGSIW